MSDVKSPRNLASTFVVLDRQLAATPVDVTETIWKDLDENFENFAGRTLVASFSFEDDWPTWEMHPNGDEIVCLVSGDVDMILDQSGGEESIRLTTPGTFVVVPKGTWHTARVHTPTTMIFVTPGEGTENREQPGSRG